jgi:hypothetical protein
MFGLEPPGVLIFGTLAVVALVALIALVVIVAGSFTHRK